MKVIKTSVQRLSVEKTCGCTAVREYEDTRLTKPLADGKFTPCDKHKSNKALAEFAGEMLLETLDKEAEAAGRAVYAPMRQEIEEGDGGGVQAVGESVQRMGVTGLPKRPSETTQNGPRRRDPLSVTHLSVDRPVVKAPNATGNLNLAGVEEDASITITGDIDQAPEDPNLSGFVTDALNQLDETGALGEKYERTMGSSNE